MLEVRGDGQRYKINLRTDDTFDGVNYQAAFVAPAHVWTRLSLPLGEFRPGFRGRPVPEDATPRPGTRAADRPDDRRSPGGAIRAGHPFDQCRMSAARDIERADWERLSPRQHPFLNADFLGILERHQAAGPTSGWHACHLLARDGDGAVLGIAPSYVKTNSHGDFVRDWSWAAAYQQLGKTYYPKLLTAVPHTPARGPRLLAGEGEAAESIRQSLIAAGKEMVAANNFSSWHIALPATGEVELFRASGLLVSHDVQFHWRDHGYGDFDGFLAAFASERRRKVRAERRRVSESGLAIEVRHGDEIAPEEWPALHRLYAATFEKFGNYAAFSPACFAELGATLGRRMVVFIARDGIAPVALSICFRSDRHPVRPLLGLHRRVPQPALRALLLPGHRLLPAGRPRHLRARRRRRAQGGARLRADHRPLLPLDRR